MTGPRNRETPEPLPPADYRLWVNEQRTVLLRMWRSGEVEIATRESPEHTWGPPVYLTEEVVF